MLTHTDFVYHYAGLDIFRDKIIYVTAILQVFVDPCAQLIYHDAK